MNVRRATILALNQFFKPLPKYWQLLPINRKTSLPEETV